MPGLFCLQIGLCGRFKPETCIDKNLRRIVVVDRDSDFRGLVTQEDLIRHLEKEIYQAHSKIFHILSNSRPLFTLPSEARLSEAVFFDVR